MTRAPKHLLHAAVASILLTGTSAPVMAKSMPATPAAKKFAATLKADEITYADLNGDGQPDIITRGSCSSKACDFRFYVSDGKGAWRQAGGGMGKRVVVGDRMGGKPAQIRLLVLYLAKGGSRKIAGAVSQVHAWSGNGYAASHLRVRAKGGQAVRYAPVSPIHDGAGGKEMCVTSGGTSYVVVGQNKAAGSLLVRTAASFAAVMPGAGMKMGSCG